MDYTLGDGRYKSNLRVKRHNLRFGKVISPPAGRRDVPDSLPAPLIIPRDQHSLSRKQIDSEALTVLYRLHQRGFLAYLVGGSVRDLLLGRRPKDFDIGTNASPEQIRKIFRNSRIIGRRFRLVQVFFGGGKIVEVSTFRSLGDEDSHQVLEADNEYGAPAEDAWRRDLTINALFYNIADFSIVDYVGGMLDLKNQIIRAVGNPDIRFHQDPVRILRALRHAARVRFTIAPDTWRVVVERRREIMVCPESRIRDELMRDFNGGACRAWLELAHASGVLYVLFPMLEESYKNPRWLERAYALAARYDLAGGPDFLSMAAFCWPALEYSLTGLQVEEDSMSRGDWMMFVRTEMARLSEPFNFTRRQVDRLCRAAAPLYFMYGLNSRLPAKLAHKAYYPDSCLLAEFLGFDLRMPAEKTEKDKKSPFRRRRRKKSANKQDNVSTILPSEPALALNPADD
jgi:poly(A) polymerase